MKKLIWIFTFLVFLLLYGCSYTFYEMGRESLDNDNYNEAAEYFKKEISASPDNIAAWRDLGLVNLKQKNYEQAEENLFKAYELDNNDGETIFYLGLLYDDIDSFDKAISFYIKYNNLEISNDEISEIIRGRIKLISRRKIEDEVKTILKNEKLTENDSIPGNTFAVLYFQNIGNNKELDPLQKGLAEMLITDLSQVKALKVIERIKLQKLIEEMQLSSSSLFDQRNAPRLGKLLKVKNFLKGTYLSTSNENLRVDASLVSVPDGSLRHSKEVTGNIADYFKMQKALVFNILNEIGIRPTDEEREAIQIIPTESYLAFLSYCNALELEDQGKYDEAIEQFGQALEIDPSFNQVQAKLDNLQSIEASSDIGKIESTIESTNDYAVERLIESSVNLTEELYTGQDDHQPYSSGDNRVKVIIRVNR